MEKQGVRKRENRLYCWLRVGKHVPLLDSKYNNDTFILHIRKTGIILNLLKWLNIGIHDTVYKLTSLASPSSTTTVLKYKHTHIPTLSFLPIEAEGEYIMHSIVSYITCITNCT